MMPADLDCHPVLSALAAPHANLSARHVDVFHPHGRTFHESQACSIEQQADKPHRAGEVPEERTHLRAAQDGGQVRRADAEGVVPMRVGHLGQIPVMERIDSAWPPNLAEYTPAEAYFFR